MSVTAAALAVTLALAFDVSAAWKNGPDGDAQADIRRVQRPTLFDA